MILILGHISVAPDNFAKLKQAAAALVAATREEEGCLGYSFGEDVNDPNTLRISERWVDETAVAVHNKTAHLAAFMGALPELAPTAVRLARYDAAGETVLVGV